MKIIVLGGGPSSEREISLRSAASVKAALTQAGFSPKLIDPSQDDSYLSDPSKVVFPILHGQFGEDGTVQKQMEERKIPFLGAGSVSSANSFDKHKTREILIQAGIKVPAGGYIGQDEYAQHPLALKPHVLKIADGGSSIGTYIIRDPSNSTLNLDKVFDGKKLVIEELIDGVELTVPILDESALPVIEIQPPDGEEFDYENKYNGKSSEACPPQSIGEAKQKELQTLAEQVHQVMECRHLSRVDIMLGEQGEAYILEINTIPGMTDQSLYPLAARNAGLPMPELMKRFYQMVARDYSLD